MQIIYESKSVEKYFTDVGLLSRAIGRDAARILIKRINALKAANNVDILLRTGLGKPHFLTGDLRGHIGITLTGNYRLIVRPVTDDLTAESLKICNIICVKGVGDYHGSKNNWLIS